MLTLNERGRATHLSHAVDEEIHVQDIAPRRNLSSPALSPTHEAVSSSAITSQQLSDLTNRFGINAQGEFYKLQQQDGSILITDDINKVINAITESYESKLNSCNTKYSRKIPYEIESGKAIKNADGTIGKVKTNHCKSRLCVKQWCIDYRKQQIVEALKPYYENAETITSVVLTIQNLPAETITISRIKQARNMFRNWWARIDSRVVTNIKTAKPHRVRTHLPTINVLEFKYNQKRNDYHLHWHVHIFGDKPQGIIRQWQLRVRKFMGETDYHAFKQKYHKEPGFTWTTNNQKNINGREYTQDVKQLIKYKYMHYIAIRASTTGLLIYDKKHHNHTPMKTIDFLMLVKHTRVLNKAGHFNHKTQVSLDYLETSLKKERDTIALFDLGNIPNLERLKDPPPRVYQDIQTELESSKFFTKVNNDYYLTCIHDSLPRETQKSIKTQQTLIDINNYL
jgi:hypothetical protein